jgi:hypothetical protein
MINLDPVLAIATANKGRSPPLAAVTEGSGSAVSGVATTLEEGATL